MATVEERGRRGRNEMMWEKEEERLMKQENIT